MDVAFAKVESEAQREGPLGAKNRRRRRRKYYNDVQRREAKRRRDKEYRERKRAAKLMYDADQLQQDDNMASDDFISSLANNAGNDYEDDDFDDDGDEEEGSVSQDLLNPIVEIEEEDGQEFSEDFSDFGSPETPNAGRRSQMTAEERLESKRRRDREYRQRKRGLDFDLEVCQPHLERKIGRRSKYATDEERLESKRLRDARYRARQKAKQLVEGGLYQEVENLNDFDNVEGYWKQDSRSNESFDDGKCSSDFKKVRNSDSTVTSQKSPTSSEPKMVNGRKYFSQEERRMAKRRRDAEYRERMRLKRLVADETAVDESAVQPIVVDINQVKSKTRQSSRSRQSFGDENSEAVVGGSGSVDVDANVEDDDLKGRKYFSAEARAQGKLRRNAEYRERLRVKKMLEDQGLDFLNSTVEVTPDGNPEILIQAFDPAANQFLSLFLPEFEARFVQKRRRYLNDEERAAAKKRRDAEYRERQKLKKLASAQVDDSAVKHDEQPVHQISKPLFPANPLERQDYPVDPAPRLDYQFTPSARPEMTPSSTIRPPEFTPGSSLRLDFSASSTVRPSFVPVVSMRPNFVTGPDFTAAHPGRPYYAASQSLRPNFVPGLPPRPTNFAAVPSVRHHFTAPHSLRPDYSFDPSQRFDYSVHSNLRPSNPYDQTALRPYFMVDPSHRPDYPSDPSYYPNIPNGLPYNSDMLISKPDHPLGPPQVVQNQPNYATISTLPEYSNFEEPDSIVDNPEASVKKKRRIYRSDADRKAAKRRRDAEYRERQRLKKMAANCDSEISYDSRLSAKTNDYENYPDFGQSFTKSYNESDQDWNSSNQFPNSDQQAKPKRKRYSTQEERAEAKRRRDAEYRERQRLKKLAEGGATDNQESETGIAKVNSNNVNQMKSESDHSLTRQTEAGWMKSFDDSESALLRTRRHRYRTQEERAAAKKRRDAEYRERQKLKKILDDTRKRIQKISDAGSATSLVDGVVVRRRRKFFSDEERAEAKRRRDSEYRDRQRLKKLLSEIEPKVEDDDQKVSIGTGNDCVHSKSGRKLHGENSSSYSVDEIFDEDEEAVNVEPVFEES